jgi:uncharacterized protein (DUF433 family)
MTQDYPKSALPCWVGASLDPTYMVFLRAMKFDRITVDPAVIGGKPCIRGLRFPVSRLLGLLAAGETRESILKNYPYLEAADIDAALHYAATVS